MKHPSVQLALVLLTTLGAVPVARAAVIVWSGAHGTDFEAGNNWVGNGAPGANDTASFTGSTTSCIINAPVTVAAINLAVATTLTQSAGNTLTVTGDFTQSAGTFSGGNGTISIGGNFNLSNGTFTSTSGLLKVSGAFDETGGTFTHNSGRVLLNSTSSRTFATNGATFYDLAINDGLVGYWKLDEGTGTSVADASGYGHTGTLFNTPTWTTGPTLLFTNANALMVNGTTQYARVSRTTALEPAAITISAWIKRNGAQSQYAKVALKTYNNNATAPYVSYDLHLNDSGSDSTAVSFQIGHTTGAAGDTITSTTNSLPDATWTHLLAVYDPSGSAPQMRLYINGFLNTSKTLTSAILYDTSSAGDFYIGQSGGATQYLNGSVDEIRVYKRALSDAEISSLHLGNQPGTSVATQTMTGAPTVVNDLTLASGTLSVGSNNMTLGGSWDNYGGLFSAGTGTVTLNTSGADVIRSAGLPFNNLTLNNSDAIVTLGANLAVTGTLAVANGALALSTFNVNTADLTLANGSITQGPGAAVALTGAYAQTGGTFTGGTSTFSVAGTSAFSGGKFTAGTGNVTLTGASTVNGGTVTLGAGTEALQSTLAVSGGTLTGGSGPVTVTGAATINGAGTINAGSSSSFELNGTLAIGSGTSGTFNADSATVSFTGAVTLQNGGAFNGNTGSGTFSAAPTLTDGTFTVADAGSTGRWTFNQSASFSSGVTLAFPTNKGELSLSPGKTLTLNGPVTSNVGTSSTLPKIDCNGCASGQGITVAFTATSTLDLNGLEFDNSVATGVSVANGARYTLFKRLKFLNNVGGVGSTHLLLTLGSAVVNAPGFYFDATAAHNVTLHGAAASPAGAVAIFENQSVATNGSGAGASLDQAGDTNEDNVGDNTSAAPYYGSVIEWVRTSTTDTAGTVVGFPAPAFDWNTFSFYGVYVAFKDTAGAGTADVLWRRNDDGSAAASYSVPQTSGDIVGTPFWDTVNETTAAVDANGNGNQTDTDVRVVYIATTLGHIIKLVDTGSGFAVPASGPWKTDFSSPSTVATISSPLIEDHTNLYFGGTNGSGPCIFGVQVAGGANEKTLQRTVTSVSLVTTTPSWSAYGGSTYVFVGSAATSNQAYVYRVNMSIGNVNASHGGVTSNVNGSAILVNDRAYAVTDGGTLHVVDASNFGSGAFKNLTGFPYQSAAASAIKAAPWVDYKTNYAYFGDDGGNLYVVTNTGANLTGYPFSISPSIKVSTSPIYHAASGVIAVGANDGYLYFVDRHNASNVPQVFKRYVITSSGTVSTVSFDANISSYLVGSSDGKLVFISAADVSDPTPGTE